MNNVATLFELQQRFTEAESLYRRALAVNGRVLGPQHEDTLTIVHNLAVLNSRQGRDSEAELLYRRALAAREVVLGPDHLHTLETAHDLAASLQAQSRFDEAERLYLRAMAGRQQKLGPDHPATLGSLVHTASIYADSNRRAEAEPLYATATEALERTLGPDHPSTIRSAAALAIVRLLMPRQSAGALAPARLAVAGLRTRRAGASSNLFEEAGAAREELDLEEIFPLLADAAWSSPQPKAEASVEEAFTALQDAIAGTASKAVVRMAVRRLADNRGAALGEIVRERERLAGLWSAVNTDYGKMLAEARPHADVRKSALLAERDRLQAMTLVIDGRLRREFPEYFSLTRPEAISVRAAQAMLGTDEAILMVLPTRFGTHTVAVTNNRVRWIRSAWKKKQVNEAVRRLLWDVGASVEVSPAQALEWELKAGSPQSYDRGTAFALHEQLVAPVADVLAGKTHVFIAAGGSLSSLPFAILVTEPPQGNDRDPEALRATKWLGDAHALIQIPSLQSLQFLRRLAPRRTPTAGSGSFIGFGDPLLEGGVEQRGLARSRGLPPASAVFSPAPSRSGRGIADLAELRKMDRLPGTARELESLRKALQAPESSIHLGERATETAIKSADLSTTRIIALATHGLTAGELKGAAEPGLVFTPPPEATEGDDGLLTASEVSAMRLDAEWVILSACNTAAGDGSSGAPGLSGLARAFFYAGAQNLVASHWPVRDDVAARLTVRTLELAGKEPALSRAQAFQRAMQEIRNDSSGDGSGDSMAHPSAWGPFVVIGDAGRSLQIGSSLGSTAR